MTATVRRIALLLALFVVVVFAVFLFNQTAQIVQSARVVNPTFGNGVMWGLIFTYSLLLITPFVLWFKVPKRVSPPTVAEGAEYDRFMADFRRRLSRNSRLCGIPLDTPENVDSATRGRLTPESVSSFYIRPGGKPLSLYMYGAMCKFRF